MKTRRDILIDLAIHLTAVMIVTAVTWALTLSATALAIPVWVAVVIGIAVSIAIAVLLAYVVSTRTLQRIQEELVLEKAAARTATDKLREMRELSRRVADNLLVGDQPTTQKLVTSYTVDPGGNDRIESLWTLAFSDPAQGRVFTTDDWSAFPTNGEVTLSSNSDGSIGTTVIPILTVEEPTRRSAALHLHPPVGTTPRQLAVLQTWPDLWKDLREKGTDYFELTIRPGLQEAKILIHIPDALGRFKWAPNNNAMIKLTDGVTGAQQTLEMLVSAPVVGTVYRADLVRAKTP